MESFNQSVIKHKTGLPGLTAELGNISKRLPHHGLFQGYLLPLSGCS